MMSQIDERNSQIEERNKIDDDSYDELMSQVDENEYLPSSKSKVKRNKIEDDSYDELMSQVDENEYLSSPKSKVKDWLKKSNPQSIRKDENNPVVKRKSAEKNQLAKRTVFRNNTNFQSTSRVNDQFRVENQDNTGRSGYLQDGLDAEAAKRQEMIFQLFSREQDLEQQRINMYRSKQNRQNK